MTANKETPVAAPAALVPAAVGAAVPEAAAPKALAAKKNSTSGASQVLSKAMAPAKPETTAPPPSAKKSKLVRDSFTIPKAEYTVLDELKQRAAALARPAKKSELLRAGIKILDSLSDAAYLAALAQVPTVKTGRPSHKK